VSAVHQYRAGAVAPAQEPPTHRPRAVPRHAAEALAAERALFARHRRRPDPALREQLVERYLPLARHVAAQYDQTGRAREDAFQVACVGLVKAVDRFDPTRGVALSSYAVPTMIGELRRWLRDTTRAVHVPRDLQERSVRVARAVAVLTGGLGRAPSAAEVAALLGWPEPDVREALRVPSAHNAASLDGRERGDDDGPGPRAAVAYDDERLAAVERRADLSVLLGRLSRDERAALLLRFGRDLTRADTAAVLGLTPGDVARIQRRAIEHLRTLHDRPPV
jgi:RNA polymerase sigma-B factor